MTWCNDASDSGPTMSRSMRSGVIAPSRSSGAVASQPVRLVRSSPTREGSRRATNSSARHDAASTHCTSSIAMSTGRSRASAPSTPTTAVAVVRGSAGSAEATRTKVAARACSCGAGKRARVASKTGPTRSASAAYESRASLSAGRACRTRTDPASADRTIADQTVDLPIPGSPSISSAPLASRRASRKAAPAASSRSRPKTVCVKLGAADTCATGYGRLPTLCAQPT